jgi:ATP-dependent Clp protease protease subunit
MKSKNKGENVKKFLITIAMLVGMVSSAYATDGVKADLTGKKAVKKVNLLINNDRTVVLKGPVRTDNIEAIMNQIKGFAQASNDNIFIIINSPGGSVVDGFELINLIKSIKAEKGIKTYCAVESEAFSMAAILATFCYRTYMHKYSNIMFHEASYGVKDSATHIKNRVEFMSKYLDTLNRDIAEQMGVTPKEYEERILGEWWLTAEEAVQFGIVDGILDTLYYTAQPPEANPLSILFGLETSEDETIVVNPLRFRERDHAKTDQR